MRSARCCRRRSAVMRRGSTRRPAAIPARSRRSPARCCSSAPRRCGHARARRHRAAARDRPVSDRALLLDRSALRRRSGTLAGFVSSREPFVRDFALRCRWCESFSRAGGASGIRRLARLPRAPEDAAGCRSRQRGRPALVSSESTPPVAPSGSTWACCPTSCSGRSCSSSCSSPSPSTGSACARRSSSAFSANSAFPTTPRSPVAFCFLRRRAPPRTARGWDPHLGECLQPCAGR